jgi:hypothetical protein
MRPSTPRACASRTASRAFHPKRAGSCCVVALSSFLNVQANSAYTIGISGIQYTIRRVSPALDAELRREASETGRTLNTVVVQTLENAKLSTTTSEHDDLDWFIGHMSTDAGDEVDAQAWLDALPVEPAV